MQSIKSKQAFLPRKAFLKRLQSVRRWDALYLTIGFRLLLEAAKHCREAFGFLLAALRCWFVWLPESFAIFCIGVLYQRRLALRPQPEENLQEANSCSLSNPPESCPSMAKTDYKNGSKL
jgi:hypothetical protein